MSQQELNESQTGVEQESSKLPNRGTIAAVLEHIKSPFKEPKETELGSETRVDFDGSDVPTYTDENGYTQRLGYPVLAEYKTEYPPIVTEALVDLYQEYREAFIPLIEKNREHNTDYQYCFDRNGVPIIFGVQIDMQPLPEEFLQKCREKRFSKEAIKEALRRQIFEIEGSMAMTPLLETLFEGQNGEPSQFKLANRRMLDGIRQKHKKPVVMLAVTEAKKKAILESEFGLKSGQPGISRQQILEKSGLDDVWGPEEFKAFVEKHGEENLPLFYVRSSDPVAKLKDPNAIVEHPILGNDDYRRMVKANSLTLNINNPNDPDKSHKINDTKEYMEEIGMAYPVESVADIFNEQYGKYLNFQSLRQNLKNLLSQLNDEITEEKKQNSDLTSLSQQNKIISKRIGQKLDVNNAERLVKFKDRKEYNQNLINNINTEIKAKFAGKEDIIISTIRCLDKVISIFEGKLSIKEGDKKNQSIEKINQAIENLNSNLNKLDLENINLDGSEDFPPSPFTKKFLDFVQPRGVSMESIQSGKVLFRGKPLTDAYGCYGHLPKSNILDVNFIGKLQKEISERGAYVFQVEMPQCVVQDSTEVFDANGGLSAKFVHFLETRQISQAMIQECLKNLYANKTQPTKIDAVTALVNKFPHIKKEFWFEGLDTKNIICTLKYVTIHRNFLLPDISGDVIDVVPGGGFNSLISTKNKEAEEGRVHGNVETRWALVTM